MLPVQAVGGKGVAEDDVGDVLALDEHDGLADGVRLGVQLLPIHDEPGVGIEAGQVFTAHAQHAARAGGGIVERAHDAGLGQGGGSAVQPFPALLWNGPPPAETPV